MSCLLVLTCGFVLQKLGTTKGHITATDDTKYTWMLDTTKSTVGLSAFSFVTTAAYITSSLSAHISALFILAYLPTTCGTPASVPLQIHAKRQVLTDTGYGCTSSITFCILACIPCDISAFSSHRFSFRRLFFPGPILMSASNS